MPINEIDPRTLLSLVRYMLRVGEVAKSDGGGPGLEDSPSFRSIGVTPALQQSYCRERAITRTLLLSSRRCAQDTVPLGPTTGLAAQTPGLRCCSLCLPVRVGDLLWAIAWCKQPRTAFVTRMGRASASLAY